MKILKSFSMFETRHWPTVPGHFIPLQSVGYYLDPDDGMTYAMLKNGGYVDEPYPSDEVFEEDGEPWEVPRLIVSDEDKATVNSVWRSCEEVVKPLIDWNLIEDIKDVALANEIFDKGYTVKIEVKEQDVAENIYVEWVAHDKDDKHYYKFFKQMFSQIENTNGDFSYKISVYKKNGPGGYLPIPDSSEPDFYLIDDLVEQVKGMNPDKELRIFYSKW